MSSEALPGFEAEGAVHPTFSHEATRGESFPRMVKNAQLGHTLGRGIFGVSSGPRNQTGSESSVP